MTAKLSFLPPCGRSHACVLTEQGAEIADVLNPAFESDFSYRQIGGLQKGLCLGYTDIENIFGSLETGDSLHLSVKLDSPDAKIRSQFLTINLPVCKSLVQGLRETVKESLVMQVEV